MNIFLIILVALVATETINIFSSPEFLSIRTLPKIHPFSSEKELKEALLNDPLGFSTKQFLHSHESYKNSRRSANEDVSAFSSPISHDVVNTHENGQISSLKYTGSIFHGTMNLDNEPSIKTLTCPSKNEMVISTAEKSLIDSIIPGTRIHIGFDKYDCPGELISRYSIVIGRKKFLMAGNEMSITLVLRELTFSEMFHELDMEFSHTPTPKNDRRQEIDKRESFMFFPFNYDKASGRAEKSSIPLYTEGPNSVTCENCYAYLDSGIILHIITSWLSIDVFKAGVYGQIEANMELKYVFDYHYDHTFSKQLYFHKFPSIKFMIGYIPLYIAPAIQLDVDAHIKVDARLTITSSFYAKEYAEMSLNYEKGGDIHMEHQVDKPTIEYQLPKIDEASKGSIRVTAGVYPQVMLYVYAIAPVKLTVVPKVYIEGDITTKKMSYGTFYGVDLELKLDPIEVPKEIPEVGGKTYDFEGRLPYGKDWNFVNHEEIHCKYCKGEVEF